MRASPSLWGMLARSVQKIFGTPNEAAGDFRSSRPNVAGATPPEVDIANLLTLAGGTSHEQALAPIAPLPPHVIRDARHFRSYDSDLPPEVNGWVGRSDQLRLLEEMPSGFIAITGIGGQGKSALAAKSLEQFKAAFPDCYWDWRDCREQGDRFTVQLAAIISRLSLNTIDAGSLSGIPTVAVAKLFFRLIRDSQGIIVFDNVDHYVDVEGAAFAGTLGVFVQEGLRARTRFKIVLTCRPRVSYADITFREVPLLGLSLSETTQLFQNRLPRSLAISSEDVAVMHELTRGHPFWLIVLSSEMERKPNAVSTLVAMLKAGEGESDRITAMLRPVWTTMNDREQQIMLLLSECTKPLNELSLENLLKDRIGSSNQFRRALRAVVAFALVSKKSNVGHASVYELHPVVRQFLRTEFPHERDSFNRIIAEGTRRYVVRVRDARGIATISIEDFEFSAVNIESHIQSGRYNEAAEAAVNVRRAFLGRGLVEEYVRLGTALVESMDWRELDKPEAASLHRFLIGLVVNYVEVGREGVARDLISRYSPHLPKDTPSRIDWQSNLCRIEWLLGNLDAAVRQGRVGVALKSNSQIDTSADASANLHLALRDAGHVEEALQYYTKGQPVDSFLAGDFEKEKRGHEFYGNLGRCVFLGGEYKKAVRFYARSWRLLRGGEDAVSVENRGWASRWIAEAYIKLGEYDKAAMFLAYARDVWAKRLPLKTESVFEIAKLLPAAVRLPGSSQASEVAMQCDIEVMAALKSELE